MKHIILILFLFACNSTFGQINNGDYELWDSTFSACYESELTNQYAVPGVTGGAVHNWAYGLNYCGIARTTESYSGNYALLLYNWYNYAHGQTNYRDSLSYRPQYLKGYFKYLTGGVNGLAQGTAKITLTRFNGTSYDTIATGTYQFDSSASYKPFQIDLEYQSALIPDSINIYIINANRNCAQDVVCNLLYLDNLQLFGSTLGVDHKYFTDANVSISPNPAISFITIKSDHYLKDASLEIFDSYGRIIDVVDHITGTTFSLPCNTMPGGIYFIRIAEEGKLIKTKKLIILD